MSETEQTHEEKKTPRKGLHMIDDVLGNCANELSMLAEFYRKHGLSDHAQELMLASENIRSGPKNKDKQSDTKQQEEGKAS